MLKKPKGIQGMKGERGNKPVTGWFNYKARQVDPDKADLIKKKKESNTTFGFLFNECSCVESLNVECGASGCFDKKLTSCDSTRERQSKATRQNK